MARDVGVEFWRVTLQGVTVQKGMKRKDAEAMAKRWQGSHCSYEGSSGLLAIKDRGDWVEIKRDHETEREWAERFEEARAGNRQKITMVERVD